MEERQENLYSIGEAAEILGISVQTLRYYDKIKLLEPAYINPNTGYRYYPPYFLFCATDFSQVNRHRISGVIVY